MTSKEFPRFRQCLLSWFETHHRRLPWRQTSDPYRIWVSEVMLQQTQVNRVLEYYEGFIRKFPTPRHLAAAELQDILKSWEGLGYYTRARNLSKAAKVIVGKMSGNPPADYPTFRKLPGVGDYTAAAVQSIAFNKPYAAVDGNVKRVLARLLLIEAPINRSTPAKIFQDKANELLDRRAPGQFNQAMMELGATVCRAKSPRCCLCPVRIFCHAFQANLQELFPIRLKSKPIPEHHAAVAVVQKENEVLITQRKTDGLLGGLWEFPGGNIKAKEAADLTCIRKIQEEVNLVIGNPKFLTRVRHTYTHFKIVVDVFHFHYISGNVILDGPVDYQWVQIHEINQYPFPRANHKFIPLLQKIIKPEGETHKECGHPT